MPARFVSLTERAVAKLAGGDPDCKPNTIIRDTALPGFAVVVGKTKSAYVVEGRQGRGGRNVRYTLGTLGRLELDEARVQARERLAELARGVNPVQKQRETTAARVREKVTLADGLKRALERDLRPATVHDYERDMKRLGWSDRRLSTITASMVAQAYRDLGGGAAASRAMRSLRRCWHLAREQDPTQPAFPVDGLKNIKRAWSTTPRRQRVIPDSLMPAWRKAVVTTREDVRDLILFALFTGCRIKEARSLAVADVDLRAGHFLFRGTKVGNDCLLPITKQLRPILERRTAEPEDDDGHVFTQSDVRKSMAQTVAVTPWSWNDLRRVFISASHRAGVDDIYCRRLTNHRPDAADAHGGYVITSPDDLREYAQRTCDYLDKLARKKPGRK